MENLVMSAELKNFSPNFWRDKRVLITGHTGFKGAWLTICLHRLGAKIAGISLPPETSPSLFELARVERLCQSYFCNICEPAPTAALIKEFKPGIIFHLAAQALVRASYRQPLETFSTNVMGTAHVLDSLRDQADTRVAVMITTDKVYRNLEWHWPYREEDALGGHDPYSASKAACEIVIDSYRKAFLADQNIAVASTRAGNVIGGGDWAEDRLIPDAVRAWQSGNVLQIRSPQSIRPWQHVLEPLFGYMKLAERLWSNPKLAGAYNFGPETHEAASVQKVITIARKIYGSGEVEFAKNSDDLHEAGWLALEIAKARALLGVQPRWNLEASVEHTMNWYKKQNSGMDAYDLCLADIKAFEGVV